MTDPACTAYVVVVEYYRDGSWRRVYPGRLRFAWWPTRDIRLIWRWLCPYVPIAYWAGVRPRTDGTFYRDGIDALDVFEWV